MGSDLGYISQCYISKLWDYLSADWMIAGSRGIVVSYDDDNNTVNYSPCQGPKLSSRGIQLQARRELVRGLYKGQLSTRFFFVWCGNGPRLGT